MEAYNQRSDFNKDMKHKINSVLAARILQLPTPPQALHALVLDGDEINTSTELMKNGVLQSNLWIPNINRQVASVITSKVPAAHVFHMSLNALIKSGNVPQGQIGFLFADFCCTFNGNKVINTSNDIETIFSSGLLSRQCVIAITCSKRGYSKQYATEAEGTLEIVMNRCAVEAGYACMLLEKKAYNNMYFSAFACYKFDLAPQLLSDFTEQSCFNRQSTYVKEYMQTSDIQDQVYELPQGHKVERKSNVNLLTITGRRVMVCFQMSVDESEDASFTQWFVGTVGSSVYRNVYDIDFDDDGVLKQKLSMSKYSSTKIGEQDDWFVVTKI